MVALYVIGQNIIFSSSFFFFCRFVLPQHSLLYIINLLLLLVQAGGRRESSPVPDILSLILAVQNITAAQQLLGWPTVA